LICDAVATETRWDVEVTSMDDRVEGNALDTLRSRELGLVANVICPFCQRATLMLYEIGAAHARVELDFTDKPPWLLALSPEGKIPLLVVGQHSIFESRAIVEYLNDTQGGKYLPADVKLRAIARSWCQNIEHLHDEVRRYFTAPTESAFAEAYGRIQGRLDLLMTRCPDELLDPVALTLVGVNVAVLFNLLNALGAGPHRFFEDNSRAWHLKEALFGRESVKRINTEEYRNRFMRFVTAKATAFAQSSEVQRHLSQLGPSGTVKNAAEYLGTKSV
jgi:glutathione S-transferase